MYNSSTNFRSVPLVTAIISKSPGLTAPGFPLTLLLAHLTNQLLHQPSPQLCHRDWNSETLSNETVRIDTIGKVTWVLADLGYTTLLWGLIHGTVCVLSMHLLLPDLLLDRAQVWLLPSLGLSARMRCWRSFMVSWPPLDWSQEALDFGEGCSCSCKVLIWIQISQSSAQMI